MAKMSSRPAASGWLQLYVSSTYCHGDSVGNVLSLSPSWIVVRHDLNRLNFKATSKFIVCPGHSGKYLGHMI